MKKIIVFILIAVQLLLSGYTLPPIVYKNYESSEPVHDFAGIFSDPVYIESYLGRTYFDDEHDWLELSVYSYRHDEDYQYLIGELKERGIEFIALLIKVDADGNYLDYRIEYRSGGHDAIPDQDELYEYYLEAKPFLESGDYVKAVRTFFSSVKKHLSKYDIVYKQQEEARKEQYEQKVKESEKKATVITIVLPIFFALFLALGLAWAYTAKLKKQLDTVQDGLDPDYYIDRDKILVNYTSTDD